MKLRLERPRNTFPKAREVIGAEPHPVEDFDIERDVDQETWDLINQRLERSHLLIRDKVALQAYLAFVDPEQKHWKFNPRIPLSLGIKSIPEQFFQDVALVLTALKLLEQTMGIKKSLPELTSQLESFLKFKASRLFKTNEEHVFQKAILFPDLKDDDWVTEKEWKDREKYVNEHGPTTENLKFFAYIKLARPDQMFRFEKMVPMAIQRVRTYLEILKKRELPADIHEIAEILFAVKVLQAERAEVTPEGHLIIESKPKGFSPSKPLPERPQV